MKKLSRLRGVLGLGVSVIALSSCADPTNSRLYVELEDQKTELEALIAQVESELEALTAEVAEAKNEAEAAVSMKEDAARDLGELESSLKLLEGEIVRKENSVDNWDRQLKNKQDELDELIEAYG